MGQMVTCDCGQRNNLDSYGYGEPRQCIACGSELPRPPVAVSEFGAPKEESFEPIFSDPPERHTGASAPTTGFETPTGDEEAPPPAEVPARTWEGGVRETISDQQDTYGRCVRCNRPFRGDWDKNPKWDGAVCHICATRADPAYKPPDLQSKRELYRPAPPKKIAPAKPADDSEAREANAKKKREVILLISVAAITLVMVNVFPVETWMAMFFAADLSQAEGLGTGWQWVIYISNFAIGALGHMAALYVALSLSNLLHPGGFEQNGGPLIYLGIAFEILNTILAVMSVLFRFFGILGTVLVGIAFVIMITMKYLMVSARFHIGFEGFVGFFIAWIMASLIMKPCVFALHKVVHGIVAAIAL